MQNFENISRQSRTGVGRWNRDRGVTFFGEYSKVTCMKLFAAARLFQGAWTAVILGLPEFAVGAQRPMTFHDLAACHRVSEPRLSPNGKWIAYVITDVDEKENRLDSDVWLIPSEGGTPRRLTSGPRHDRHPTWSPDSQWIAFESNRDGDFQVYVISTSGGEAHRVTGLSTGATQPVWSPDGKHLAFVSSVFPEYSNSPFGPSDAANKARLEILEKGRVKARIYDQLFVRHWDTWSDGRRQHLFVLEIDHGRSLGDPKDLTPGSADAVPNSSTFSAGDEFAFSPDGRHLAHTASSLPARNEAWDTNYDLWEVEVSTGARRKLTSNPAADGCPHYSPDGRWLAYRAQSRAGFEADRWQLMLMDRTSGTVTSATAGWDASIEDLAWSGDSRTLLATAEDRGTKLFWRVPVSGGVGEPLFHGGAASDATMSLDGKWVYGVRSHLSRPGELFRVALEGGKTEDLTDANQGLRDEVLLTEPESVTVPGANGTPIQMWILRPPHYQEGKRYPLVFWVHGGPQSAFLDSWSYRWNAELWSAQGYLVALPNPRGSTGFGQQFTDEISRDWGGKVYEDLMACLESLEKRSDIDTNRMAAAGASYGGYMMNWFQGHTDKFKTLVTHCGVYDFTSMYGATDELWFDEWEHGIPWGALDFNQWSPHVFAKKFRTPNLIIHNENDFRVPLNQGLALFTTLQRQGIPSKLLIFPDEGHWVLKPKNSELWHQTIFDWLATYLKPGQTP